MDYRSFVGERAQKGDLGAQRVLDALVKPARSRQHAPEPEPRRMTLQEVRLNLDAVRAEGHAASSESTPSVTASKTSKNRRDWTVRSPRSAGAFNSEWPSSASSPIRSALASRSSRRRGDPGIRWPAWRQLKKKNAYARSSAVVMSTHWGSSCALSSSTTFRGSKKTWPTRSCGIIATPRHQSLSSGRWIQARANRDEIRTLEHRVEVLERAGISHVEVADVAGAQRFDRFMRAIDQQYRALPEAVRSQAERSIARERRGRQSMTIDR